MDIIWPKNQIKLENAGKFGRVLELAGVVWGSSWWLRSCGTTTRNSSSSLLSLLRPAQTVVVKSTKGFVLKGPLVSTLVDLVSTHCPKPAQNVFWEGL
ncbi:hypothetical protein Taro_025388 [Colocasia esculenta]|uniref:Uncharacterized protein n=1 Tax=Colocasia esculenta TaxID=4460 RepID=A0A843VA14_COLES|nr:hypothetical protein [Colocasia esculenta]